jgi:hypothetical protein
MPLRRRLPTWSEFLGGIAIVALVVMLTETSVTFTLSQRVWWMLLWSMIAVGFSGVFWFFGWFRGRLRDPIQDRRDLRRRLFSLSWLSMVRGGGVGIMLFCVVVWLNGYRVDSPVASARCVVVENERITYRKGGSETKVRLRVVESGGDFVFRVSSGGGWYFPVGRECEMRFVRGRLGWWILQQSSPAFGP